MNLKFYIAIIFITANLATANARSEWHWQNPMPQGHSLNDICVFDQNVAIAIGYNGTIIKTRDGGITWKVINSTTSERLYSVDFVESKYGFIVGGWGTLEINGWR